LQIVDAVRSAESKVTSVGEIQKADVGTNRVVFIEGVTEMGG
jgi:hypothetical protein